LYEKSSHLNKGKPNTIELGDRWNANTMNGGKIGRRKP
jgi:hypothetical protein